MNGTAPMIHWGQLVCIVLASKNYFSSHFLFFFSHSLTHIPKFEWYFNLQKYQSITYHISSHFSLYVFKSLNRYGILLLFKRLKIHLTLFTIIPGLILVFLLSAFLVKLVQLYLCWNICLLIHKLYAFVAWSFWKKFFEYSLYLWIRFCEPRVPDRNSHLKNWHNFLCIDIKKLKLG